MPAKRSHEREEPDPREPDLGKPQPKPEPKPPRRRIDVTLDGLKSLAEIQEEFPKGTILEIAMTAGDELAIVEVEVVSVRHRVPGDVDMPPPADPT